jgi:hypothetical protein
VDFESFRVAWQCALCVNREFILTTELDVKWQQYFGGQCIFSYATTFGISRSNFLMPGL